MWHKTQRTENLFGRRKYLPDPAPTPQNVEQNILEYIDRKKSTVFFMLTTC